MFTSTGWSILLGNRITAPCLFVCVLFVYVGTYYPFISVSIIMGGGDNRGFVWVGRGLLVSMFMQVHVCLLYMCHYVLMIHLDNLFVLVIVYLLLCFTPNTELLNLYISNAGLHWKTAPADVKCNTRINKSLKKKRYEGMNRGFTPRRHLRSSSGQKHTIYIYICSAWWWG